MPRDETGLWTAQSCVEVDDGLRAMALNNSVALVKLLRTRLLVVGSH